MTYTQAIDYLFQLRQFGTKLGLETTFRLAELCGNPQHHLRFIHVAGTNGKGSTCAMLENIYRTSGLRVGLFTSPHLVSFTERIRVNRQNVSESSVVHWVELLLNLISQENGGKAPEEWVFKPTFFEFVTVMALQHFREAKCDLVIWETGMGGRLDATNIVTPLASVITNVQHDHQQWLGDTLAKIAFEKGGIIKPGIPVVTGPMAPEVLQVIENVAREKGSLHFQAELTDEYELSLPGAHQLNNAAVVLKIVEVLQDTLATSPTAVKEALRTTVWAGRLQQFKDKSGREFLLDGAHNLDGVAALAVELKRRGGKFTFILGMLADKNWPQMLAMLAPLARKIITAPVHSLRTSNPADLAQLAIKLNSSAEVVSAASLAEAFRMAAPEQLTVVTGSLHFIGEAMELLGALPSPVTQERGLNEWSAAGPAIASNAEKHKLGT